ncbi:Phosphoinositide phosphatase SAC2 [Sesamum angolense]|uniref:Phosphoinositide phosphatase SAC2 n=1 Tax=Sesamum angolense TaxID=2727404 RepID=A0AAE1WK98_9LAMI|nr:Phosphoinositide phosphatase SAC2 [Sesamum angolense]
MGSMALENEQQVRTNVESNYGSGGSYLQKFRLYETRSVEIHEGNKSTGGLKFVTTCYGIVGFIKFLGPYYMLLITKRRKIGTICGHAVYSVAKSEMIPIPNATVHSNMAYSKNENRSFANSTCKFVLRALSRSFRYSIFTSSTLWRYLKRGVNEKGRVANDVETEQIVLDNAPEGSPIQISSVVQNRGSIPLFWSQETSRLNIKPDIILSKKDDKYEATKLHFENLTREKKPRESILRAEFAHAIEAINKDLTHENRLKFLHWDLSKYSRNKASNVLAYLVKVAANALDLTGFFYCQVLPSSSQLPCSNNCNGDFADEDLCNVTKDAQEDSTSGRDVNESHFLKPPVFQKGVLRTNCIDCLDRTNVAQYVYGLVALGHQLHALGYINVPSISLDSPLADDLMKTYEAMGDTLALQYGGSAAHNKIFSERRGQWKAATQSQELLRTLQRYYSNAYMDAEKQDAINVFLGHFQPQPGKPALWELDSDQHYNVGRRGSDFAEENARSIIKRSLSDGNILCDSNSPIDDAKVIQMDNSHRSLPAKMQGCNMGHSDSTPEFSTCESDMSYSRYTPSMSRRQLFPDMQPEHYLENDSIYFVERGDSFNCSNFLDVDWLSSSGNSCEEDTYERSWLIGSPYVGLSSGEIKVEAGSSYRSGSSIKGKELASGDLSYSGACSSNDLTGFSETFVHWVNHGNMLFP